MNATVESILTKNQKRTFRKDFTENGKPVTIIATVRFDDKCGNGHNSFAITGERYEWHTQRGEPTVQHKSGHTLWLNSCGCIHDDIAKHFPELAPLIKWHLSSTDGPMHYVANTVYHADGHGPKNAYVYYTAPAGDPLNIGGNKERLLSYANREEALKAEAEPGYRVKWDAKTSKKRDLDAARRAAVWPDATDAELMQEPEELRKALEARLPALLEEFRRDVESLGFVW